GPPNRRAETVGAMFAPEFRASDQMPALGMGFYETWWNNLRWIGHEGDLIAFHSLFFVERSERLVLFISFNSARAGGRVRPELVQMFSDRYFPSERKQTFAKLPVGELKAIEGTYQSTRRADSTKIRLSTLMSQRSATVDKDGVLQLEDVKDLRGHIIKWKPLEKNFWQQVDGQRRLYAIRDANEEVVRLAYDFPGVQAERVRWFENAKFVLTGVGLSMLTLFAVILAPFSRTVRRLA